MPTQRIIATGDVRHGRDTKLVVARNRWFESISLQRRVNKLSVPLKTTTPVVRSSLEISGGMGFVAIPGIAIALVPQFEVAINLPLPLIKTKPWPSGPECILQTIGRHCVANPGEGTLFLHFTGAFHEGGKREPR